MVSRVVHDCMWPQCVRACGVCVCIVSTAAPVVDALRAPRCQAVPPRLEGRGGRLHARLGRRAASGAGAWGGVSLRVFVFAVTMMAASSGVDWAAGSILPLPLAASRPRGRCAATVSPMLPVEASQRCDQHRQGQGSGMKIDSLRRGGVDKTAPARLVLSHWCLDVPWTWIGSSQDGTTQPVACVAARP